MNKEFYEYFNKTHEMDIIDSAEYDFHLQTYSVKIHEGMPFRYVVRYVEELMESFKKDYDKTMVLITTDKEDVIVFGEKVIINLTEEEA